MNQSPPEGTPRDRARTFQDLLVWKKAHTLTVRIYQVTGKFPAAERFGLVSQMRRAAVSIPANIAEGFKKRGVRDKLNFYNIAQGSLEELRYFVILSKDLGYLAETAYLASAIDEVGRMLYALVNAHHT